MKTISTLFTLMILAATGFGQTTYTINTSGTYSASCTNCTFNIAPTATLTINQAGSCNNCSFNGGNIIVEKTITCQPCSFNGNNITMTDQAINPNSGTTSFQNVVVNAKGVSSITANTPVNITNSVFTFNGTSFFNNNGGTLEVSNSTLNFFGNASFVANAGPVNLKNASKLVAGNGPVASQASIKINGPALNIYDNASAVVLANNNNYYFNWSSYNAVGNNKSYATTYPNAPSTLNCGGAGQHACGLWSSPTVYGPAAATAAGMASTTALLPVILSNFGVIISNDAIVLAWSTAQESSAAYFGVERSANGTTWQKIGETAAKGNTTSTTRYTFTDASPLKSLGYYRLAMVDQDGKKTLSEIKAVNASPVKGISFYPNPAVDIVNVSINNSASETTVTLMNQSGQVLQERKAGANETTVSLPVQQYPRGMYILKVVAAGGAAQVSKLMIAH
ncbi:MAG: T9SS type A sorting domain-containing protein [Chitinophagaceae bacterium]